MLTDSPKIRKLLITITWISFFMSINLNPIEFDNLNIINKLRISAPFLLMIILFFLIKKINYLLFMKIDFLIFNYIFLSYCFFNIYNPDNNNMNLYWPIYMFLSLFFIVSILDQKEREYLTKLTILIIFFGFIFYFSLAIVEMYNSGNLNFYGIMGSQKGYMGLRDPPRSSGLARLSLILFSFLFLVLVAKNPTHYKKLLILLIIISATITLMFKSRAINIIWIIIFISIIFFYINIIKNKIGILIFIFIIPVIISSSYELMRISLLNNKIPISSDIQNAVKNTILRKTDDNNFSSGRYQNWHKAYKLIKEKPLVGFGAQSDRIYIKQSIHNGFLYSFMSGGLIAGFLFLLICFRILYFFVRFLINRSLLKNFNLTFCLILTIILSLRSILETSFAVYSIDYLIFILAFANLSDHLSKKINE